MLAALAFSGLGVFWLYRDLPDIDTLPARLHTPSVRILDRNGRLLYEALDEQSGRHTVVALERIPLACQSAAVATEDRSFYRNPGFDLRGVLRSVWINLRGGEALAGGSTITQQAARNLLMDDKERGERTLRRKLREVVLAWELTRKFSKDDILAMYLNQTYYGGMAYGIEAAAQTFFGKPVERLDLAECALLAGLPQAPALYNPFSDLEAARKRQAIVLGLMEEAGMISPEDLSLAERERLVFAEQPYPIEAPHFVMQVRSQIDGLLSQQEVYDLGGLEVRTTIDLDWQKHAERAVLRQIEAMQRSSQGLGHDMNNAALVALDPKNGDILAMVGSPDYFDPEHGGAINMALSPRQPGSALKPLVYAAALDPHEAGGGWTAATMLLDVQTAFVTRAGKAYVPANYDLREHGPVLLREALGSSLNIPAVRTLEHVGLDQLFSLSRKTGLTTLGDPQEYDLSVALGGGAVRLLDLTSAYAAFASEGVRVQSRYILEISDLGGNEVYKAPDPARTRVIDARVAWLISDILSDNNARRLGFGVNSVLRLDRPAAVKTGTTTNFHDNWTLGYTPDLVVGVWAGNTDYKPMREVNGLTGAAPIWHEFMRTVLAGRPKDWFVRPQGLVQVEVCALSGLLPTESCPYRRKEWFIEGTQPQQRDTFYRQVFLDQRTGALAEADTPVDQREARVVLDLPPQAWSWGRAQGLALFADLQQQGGAGKGMTAAVPVSVQEMQPSPVLALISPAPGSSYILSSGLPNSVQRILLEAIASAELVRLDFRVDGVTVGSASQKPYLFYWVLEAGNHTIQAIGTTPEGTSILSPEVEIHVSQR